MSGKTKTVLCSLLICLALLMLTGCGEGKEAINIAKNYAMWEFKDDSSIDSRYVSLNDIATNLMNNVSWKAEKIIIESNDGWIITLKGKIRTEYPDPSITKTFNDYFSRVSIDLTQYTISFCFVIYNGIPCIATGNISNGSETEQIQLEEEKSLLDALAFLYKAIYLTK